MKAKIVMVGFEVEKLRVRFDCFLEKGEAGYEDCIVDVLDAEGKPTGNKRLNPINCHFVKVSHDITKEQLKEMMRAHLQALKLSIPKVVEAEKEWMGLEVVE